MAISSTKFNDVIRFRVLVDAAVTASTISQNVGNGHGRLFSVRVDNSKDASNAVYVKIYDVVSPTLGTTYPCLVFRVDAAVIETFQIPYGLSYESLSVGLTSDADPVSTSAPGSSTSITLICS
jgi:hypothetical protein